MRLSAGGNRIRTFGSGSLNRYRSDKVSFSHHVLFNAFKLFSKSYSASERAALFHDTAARAYRISERG
jgi:predicted TIM-barrel fold metal-dependent hydrolase